MEAYIYIIRCLTNLHAGAGSTTAGIVDNEVQRDPITAYPIIHASSLKGALRAHFEGEPEKKDDLINNLFGKENKGALRFLDAHLVVRPLRCLDKPYILATTETILEDIKDKLQAFLESQNIKLDPQETSESENVTIEDFFKKPHKKIHFFKEPYNNFFGEKTVILNKAEEETFKKLPVVARNHLENGISTNIWYEEFVPRESRFWFAVFGEKDMLDKFHAILENRPYVQIGANATVGYGYTKIERFEIMKEENNV